MATMALLVAALPCLAFAQPDSASYTEDPIQQLVDEIHAIRSLRGANSPDSIAPLTALSLLYEERGEADLALALIVQATEVIEVNHGLHTLDEAQLMRRSIRMERRRGNAEAAWNEEQELLALIRRYPNDARTVPILHEIADARLALLARYATGERPPEILLGCYYSEWQRNDATGWHRSGCGAGSRRTVINALFREAHAYRVEAANIERRRARWIESPCVKPELPGIADEHSRRRSAVEAAYLRAMGEYAACSEVKYAHAESTSASPDELSRLASDASAAADALAQRTAGYEERFGPIRTAVACKGNQLPPSYLSREDFACMHSGVPPRQGPR
jgi:hypothetical protein